LSRGTETVVFVFAVRRHRLCRASSRSLTALLGSPLPASYIVSGQEGCALNTSYRRKDYATNVLTFDYQQSPVVIADLVLCAPVVATEAKAQGKSLKAHYAHLLVHGALHAQGWDHETSLKDAKAMEAYEVQILAGLGIANPYA
jgi:probable rRNA maturation factor